jgi:hypothetical protein
LYFGDRCRYDASRLKIVTVALNPSRHEFPVDDRFRRFPPAATIDPATLDDAARMAYLAALDGYFRHAPYRPWFAWFEHVLRGLDASYDDGAANAALHTDLCSPLATDPTWSHLPPARQARLFGDGRRLWHRLAARLAPDVIVISLARRWRDRIAFADPGAWRPLVAIPRADPAKRSYQAWTQWTRLAGGAPTLLVYGPAAQLPFATLDRDARRRVGRAAWERFRARESSHEGLLTDSHNISS